MGRSIDNTAKVNLGTLGISLDCLGKCLTLTSTPDTEGKAFLISFSIRLLMSSVCTLARRSAKILFKLGERLK